jgi:hypothetical protein
MILEEEDSVSGFLGVHLDHNTKKGTTTLTQKDLTKRIVNTLSIDHLPTVRTPSVPGITIPSHELDGDPPVQLYSYPSVIGMLRFLSVHSKPDITFAVAQCAKYTHNPTLQHKQTLERIGTLWV